MSLYIPAHMPLSHHCLLPDYCLPGVKGRGADGRENELIALVTVYYLCNTGMGVGEDISGSTHCAKCEKVEIKGSSLSLSDFQ